MARKFQASVADIVLRDAVTREAIAHGKTNTTTSLAQTMSVTEARGGIGNQLLYTYFTDRAVEFTIDMPVWNTWMLALQSGQSVGSGNYSVVDTDCMVLSSGSGQLAHTPTGEVTFIFDDNDAAVLVTPTGSNITVAGGLNRKGVAIYDYLAAADQIKVEGNTQPDVVELVMTANVYDQDHETVVQNFQVNVPLFKFDGNYSLSMTGNEISSQSLTGRALLKTSSDCSGGDYYYTATYINVDGTTSAYTALASTPSPMTFSVATGSATQAITVLGYRGPVHDTGLLTSSCTYDRTSGSFSSASSVSIDVVPTTGVVAASGSMMYAGDSAVIGVSYWDVTSGSITDNVYVSITA